MINFCIIILIDISIKRAGKEDLAFNMGLLDFLSTGGGKTAFRMTEAAL